MKPCPKCGMPVRYMRLGFGRREVHEFAGDVLVLNGTSARLKRVKSYLPHQCSKKQPADPIERAALTATDPVARAAFAALLPKGT